MTDKRYQFEDVEAVREKIAAKIGISGPTGSGKSWTALKIGSRIVERLVCGPLFVIDSEHRSALRYAVSPRSGTGFKFRHVPMPENDFQPAAYIAALEHCEAKGAGVVIIDSLSHAWSGINGVLELVDRATASSRSKNTFSEGWKQLTPVQVRFIERIMQSPAHVIFTLRAKTDWIITENERGKSEPKKIGMAPVQREGLDYEPDLFFEMDTPEKSSIKLRVAKSRAIDNDALTPGTMHLNPGDDFADQIIAWIEDGEAPASSSTSAATPPASALDAAMAKWQDKGAQLTREDVTALLTHSDPNFRHHVWEYQIGCAVDEAELIILTGLLKSREAHVPKLVGHMLTEIERRKVALAEGSAKGAA